MIHPFENIPKYRLPDDAPSAIVGDEQAKVWVILRKGEAEDTALLNLLKKILGAIDIDVDKELCQIIISEERAFYLSKLLPPNKEANKIVFAFGVTSYDLGMATKPIYNQIFSLVHHQFIFTDKLAEINTVSEKKRALWNAIRSLKINDEKN